MTAWGRLVRSIGRLCIALSVVGTVMLLPEQGLADSVSVNASTQDGFGRLTFRWPQPVGHQAAREGDRLVVRFSRPIQADLRPALRNLGAYIASIEPTANEATVAFRLKGDFSVRSYDAGSSVVVDIVGSTPTTAPTAAKAGTAAVVNSAPAGKAAARVPVRTGVHDAYSRIVFDWPTKTAYTLARNGNQAVLSFATPGAVDVAALAGGRVRNISDASADVKDGKLVVTLNVDPTSNIKASTSGAKVVVDVYRPGTQAAAAANAVPAPAPTPEPTPAPAQVTAPTPTPLAPTPLAPTPLAPQSRLRP